MPKNEFGDETSVEASSNPVGASSVNLVPNNPTVRPSAKINEFGDPIHIGDTINLSTPAYERPLRNTAIDFARPFVSDATKAGVTALTKSPTAGYLSAGVLDALMQHLKSGNERGAVSQMLDVKPDESLAGNIENTVLNTGEQFGINKLFGYPVDPVVRGATNVITKSGVDPQLAKLGATYSDYLDPNSFTGKMGKWVEDAFARRSKMSAQEKSAGTAFNIGKNEAAGFAGRSVNTVSSPELHAQLVQQETIANQKELGDAFDNFSTEAQFYKPKFASGPLNNQTSSVTPIKQINPNYDPIKYQQANANAKAVGDLHDSLFDEKGLSGLVSDPNNTAVPFINQILADPQKLERALKSSNLPIPGTNGVTSPQLKNDLKGFFLNDVIDKAATRDDITGKITHINTQRLSDLFNDPSMTESVKQLFTANERSDLTQLFRNAAKTQQKMEAGFSTGAKVFMAGSGIEIAGSLLSGHTSWGLIGALPMGIKISGGVLGKLMTNPTLARTLVSLTSGQPTGIASKMLSKALVDGLSGMTINMIDSNGQEHEGKIENGEFVPSARH